MSGFSNSLSHFYVIQIRYSNSYIQQLHKSHDLGPISSLDLSVGLSVYQTYIIFAMMDRLPKKFAEPIHSSTATALPSPIQFAMNADNVTSKPEPETRVWHLPNPKTRVYKRNPGLETLLAEERPCDINVVYTPLEGKLAAIPSPTIIQVYLNSFSRGWLPNLRNHAKFREYSNL